MTVEIVVPELGESVLEATVYQWFKQEGDRVEVGDVLVELETDKVNLEVGAKQAGVLEKIMVRDGEDVQVGEVLGTIAAGESRADGRQPEDASREKMEAEQTDAQPAVRKEAKETTAAAATPLAKRVAEDLGVDVRQVSGSGIGGKVTKGDVRRFAQEGQDGDQSGHQVDGQDQARTAGDREERVRMSRRRRTIAKTLVAAQQNTASLTTFNEVDISAVMDLRKRKNSRFREKHGIKLGIASFFIKAAVGALKDFPRLNAEIDGDEIVLKRHYDIGVAIGDEDGLVVPVLREADRKSFAQIEQEIAGYVEAVREKSLALEDLRGGTFSVTNGGVFGSLLSTPILNPPQVGILGLHKIEPRPMAIEEEVVIRPMMYVALTYDHRIVDGREAVQFLVRIKEMIEDPEQLLLAG